MTYNSTFNVTDDIELMAVSPRWIEIMSAIWLIFVFVFGALENSAVLYVFAINKHFVTPNNIPVIAMVLNCLCMSAFATHLPIIAEMSSGWHTVLNNSWCTFEAFIVYFFGLTSLYLLTHIALMRYVTITNVMQSMSITNTHAMLCVTLCYVVSGVFSVCPLLGFGSYGLESHGTSCGLAWKDRSTNSKLYLVVILVLCFLLPVAMIVVSYVSIYKVVSKSTVFPMENAASMRLRNQQMKERKLLKLSIIMISTYLICWTPYALVSFYITFGNPEDLGPFVTRIPALLAKSEVVCNPIVYTLQTKPFRTQIYRLIPFKCIRDRLLKGESRRTNVATIDISRSDAVVTSMSNANGLVAEIPKKACDATQYSMFAAVQDKTNEGPQTLISQCEGLASESAS